VCWVLFWLMSDSRWRSLAFGDITTQQIFGWSCFVGSAHPTGSTLWAIDVGWVEPRNPTFPSCCCVSLGFACAQPNLQVFQLKTFSLHSIIKICEVNMSRSIQKSGVLCIYRISIRFDFHHKSAIALNV
jgi:hypothetical protein